MRDSEQQFKYGMPEHIMLSSYSTLHKARLSFKKKNYGSRYQKKIRSNGPQVPALAKEQTFQRPSTVLTGGHTVQDRVQYQYGYGTVRTTALVW